MSKKPEAEFEIELLEIHISKIRVKASSKAEAILKAVDSDGEFVDGGTEYLEPAEERGMPIENNQELAEQLRQLGFDVEEGYIPTIRSIERTYDDDDEDEDDDCVLNVLYVSVFDDEISVTSPCKYNVRTKTAFAIQDGNIDVADNANAMTDEYVRLEDGTELRADDGVKFNY